ncbi:MAG: DNA translocase FtsK [Candidatus Wolfebacteria bacterium]|nr:DNA translocase FtsK [Candidatus Wolfebacteria bacterium]
MANKKNKKNKKNAKSLSNEESENGEKQFRLHPDTKKSVFAIGFLALALILILARFGNAGPVGDYAYNFFNWLFGVGYFLLPLIFIIMAVVFLTSERRRIFGVTFVGAIVFVLSSLGLIDIFYSDKAGIFGWVVGSIESLFGRVASIIVVIAMIVASFLITLNLPIKIRRKPKESILESEVSWQEENGETKRPDEKREEDIQGEETEEIEPKVEVKERFTLPFSRPAKIQTSRAPANYVFPPLDLLKSSVEKPTPGDLRANANIIKRTLDSFGIPVEMGEINVGPKVTRYTLKPAEGVKLARITALSSDLSMALAAHPIRIEAPIPGKSLVGIEVPNKAASIVRLGSLMAYPEFSAAGSLGFALGRDVTGEPIFASLEKMPHMLVAGSTGSGKSVSIHSLLISLLYKNSPDNLKMILIDPKRVELTAYSGIPHLIAPVVTESKKSLGVFKWALREMDGRYEILESAGSRDIKSYNKKNPDSPLPFIIIVIDELADLMSTYGREVEGSVVRLAQMARATGIHLILATQRPSVEVITGLIKANITTRVALQVASQIDSRTILDSSGAEKLLGGGDMLYITSDLSKPRRIQGAYVSEEEINKVTQFIRENNGDYVYENAPTFENGLPSGAMTADSLFDGFENDNDDELLEEAIAVVTEAQKASASLLQRRLKVGYARAARLLDIMEAKGIIGPGDGAKPREVYVKREI